MLTFPNTCVYTQLNTRPTQLQVSLLYIHIYHKNIRVTSMSLSILYPIEGQEVEPSSETSPTNIPETFSSEVAGSVEPQVCGSALSGGGAGQGEERGS